MSPERCDGIVLAAGAGRRYGMPKVLAEDGRWLRGAVAALRDGGCARIIVVLGATGPAHRTADGGWVVSQTSGIAIPEGAQPVWAADWNIGVSASMRAGLAAAAAIPNLADPHSTAWAGPNQAAAELGPTRAEQDRAAAGPNLAGAEPDRGGEFGAAMGDEPAGGAISNGSGAAAGLTVAAENLLRRGGQVSAARTAKTGNTSVRNTYSRNAAAGSSGAGWGGPAEFVAIMPVDTPDVGADVVARVIGAARASESRLARAVFGDAPGHPVVLGRGHWAGVCASAAGNSGAGTYLRQRADMVCVTCDDLATGIDRDYPAGSAL
ncbi:NTP transferase domain-containing protein [Nocardia sp. NPDC059240]|uniref:nucleotidyltransferase family protein n=1 Tax=Nocardia sp. NPDC059240 TaxID=3346786 RepID=UPI0036C0C9A3